MRTNLLFKQQEDEYTLSYYLLKDGEYYGLAAESNSGFNKNSVYCYRVSREKHLVLNLLEKAAGCKVFPCALPGVVEDFLYELKEV